jgi:hypothetical protein
MSQTRICAGRLGRLSGLQNEKKGYDWFKNNFGKINNFINKEHLINSKHHFLFLVDNLKNNFEEECKNIPNNIKNYIDLYGEPKDNKRASDILLIIESDGGTIKHFGFDIKKKSRSSPQLCCLSMNTFWNNKIKDNRINSLQEYLDYTGKKRKFNKYHNNFIQIKKDIFNIIKENKIDLIKKRNDTNELYFVDYIIQLDKNDMKIVNVNNILSLFDEDPIIKKTNFCFGKYLVFKPHGSSRRDPQISLSCKIFNDNNIVTLIK